MALGVLRAHFQAMPVSEVLRREGEAQVAMLKAVEKKRAYERHRRTDSHSDQKGKLKQGDQLPTERELTETFKVSRTTVREAIRCPGIDEAGGEPAGQRTYVLASSEEA